LYSYLSERFAAASSLSPVIRGVNPAKLNVLLMHIGSQLGGGRLLSREEVAALPLEALEGAVASALLDFPSWAKPKASPVRVSPVQRLEDANAEIAAREARKAEQRHGEQPTVSHATKRAAIASLPPHLKLALGNNDPQLRHLLEPKK
jgi:hypothetical protein